MASDRRAATTRSPRRRTPRRVREHWYTLAVALVALALSLALQGYASHGIGDASTRGTDTSAAVGALTNAGPILDLTGDELRARPVPDRTVALTFDDGPHPRWTPAVLDVLARHGVPATFFVLGSHVASHPGVVARIVREGHEIGNHTFTHVDLAHTPGWLAGTELRLTEVATAAAAGRHTRLFRPPYSSTAAAVRARTLDAWRRELGGRYLVALSTHDSQDWDATRSVDEIVAASLPAGRDGAVVLMHDGGGDRRRTVAALERVVTTLQDRGYRFTTMGELAQLPGDGAMPAVGPAERLRSRALPAALTLSSWIARAFTIFAALVAILVVLRAVLLLLFARRHADRANATDPGFTPSVTIVVPAYNEEAGIEPALRSLARSRYPCFDIVVVDDGSTDRTPAVIDALLAREKIANVRVLRQRNTGKPAALNAGIAHATGEIVVTVDADTVFAPDALAMLVRRFVDPRIGAVSGNTKVANRRRLLGRWQHVEYVMGFNLDRRMHDLLGCMPTVPGAIGAFRAAALREAGGFSDDTLAEDTDVTMALHRAGWGVAYEAGAVAWTEAPSSLRDLWRQRYRWSYGTTQSVWKHRRAVVERGRGGRLGRLGLPYLVLFQVALPLLGPAVDVFALYGLCFLDARVIGAYWLGFTAMQVGVTAYALRLDREPSGPLWTVPLQQFVYRQLMYLVVLQSVATALAGARVGWHRPRRTGAITESAPDLPGAITESASGATDAIARPAPDLPGAPQRGATPSKPV